MINNEIADIFDEIADIYEMNDVQFKPRAYQKAAISLRSLTSDVKEIYRKDGLKGLEEISGIGQSMAEKIEEYVKTGKIKDYQKMKKKMPARVEEMAAIEGVGPKIVKKVYDELGVKTLKQLEAAAKAGKVREIEGLGEKVEQNILEGIKFLEQSKGRKLLGYILPEAKLLTDYLKNTKLAEKIDVVGSIRRGKETIGDIDILAISKKPKKVIGAFCSMPNVEKVYGRGPTKGSIRLEIGLDADLRVLPAEDYGAGLLYFTGSKFHNIKLREIAFKKDWKLNEYGLFKSQITNSKSQTNHKLQITKKQKYTKIAGRTEDEIYEKLGLSYIEPEIREERGEIEAAIEHKLPKLVERENIKGMFHVHSNWSHDASGEILEIAKKCQKMGLKYLVMGDHAGHSLKIASGIEEGEVIKYIKFISNINKKLNGFRVLSGLEVNILKDGKLDLTDEVLEKLDVVIGAVHSNFKMKKAEMTERIVKAMQNKNMDILAHPTGRLLGERDEYELDIDEIIKAAKKTKTCLEINAYPNRLDLNDINIKKAVENGVKLTIGVDSHSVNQLEVLDFGVITARRGWAEAKDIVNTLDVDEMLKYFRN